MSDLEQIRASQYGIVQATGVIGAANAPLVIDMTPVTAGYHWIVEEVNLLARAVTTQPSQTNAILPASGLFLCPNGTGPVEPGGATQLDLSARPIVIPLNDVTFQSVTEPSGTFVISLASVAGFKFTVPMNWFIRAILYGNFNTNLGPGTGSAGTLSVVRMVEANCQQ